ncbi:efflux RND transporter periplasmic adaptor subunit [Treponema sp.]|uniref:efflux RND transporter periplasmic adaptor subunit n=1 Tax=Treponema sp. TaxID=166 RepID=UPI00298EAD59|nr:efflux RND transporter periplasmic adaptor subunit [Treponema sp.]MCR5614204.1 efflux RND transporter periplasmic adaptor subunit [Treponema sp.]
MKTIMKMLIVSGLFVMSMNFFPACSKTDVEEESSQKEPVQAVRVEKLETSDLRKFIELNGNIRAEKSMNVYPIVSGKISGTPVHLGSTVKKGDTVAFVDPSLPGSRYSLNAVTSPINGTVISIPLKEGTRVNTETAVVVIGDLSKLQIITYIPERYVSYLKAGLEADISLEAYPDEIFSAVISEISPVLDEATRTKEIILTFTKKDARINAGMFAGVKLYIKNYAKVLSVPTSCIIEKNGSKFVYLIDDENTESRQTKVKLAEIKTEEEIQNRTIINFIEQKLADSSLSSTEKKSCSPGL